MFTGTSGQCSQYLVLQTRNHRTPTRRGSVVACAFLEPCSVRQTTRRIAEHLNRRDAETPRLRRETRTFDTYLKIPLTFRVLLKPQLRHLQQYPETKGNYRFCLHVLKQLLPLA
jgi:hypothetical protein